MRLESPESWSGYGVGGKSRAFWSICFMIQMKLEKHCVFFGFKANIKMDKYRNDSGGKLILM